jgi:hypothetical protein
LWRYNIYAVLLKIISDVKRFVSNMLRALKSMCGKFWTKCCILSARATARLNFSGNMGSAAILISFSEIIRRLVPFKGFGKTFLGIFFFNLLSPYSKPNRTYHFLMTYWYHPILYTIFTTSNSNYVVLVKCKKYFRINIMLGNDDE